MVKAVRGAVSLEKDSPEELRDKVALLYGEIEKVNDLSETDIISIIFSQTGDISYNPAKALREARGISRAPLFCTQEPVCIDFPQERMLRVLITFNSQEDRDAVPVYLGQAAELRRDIEDRA